ncbi:MAG: hemerythrin family protein [Deltaproteobacteria bacterium]|nr:hemerythrin family protein [Deltaproteobacteria bacterium]
MKSGKITWCAEFSVQSEYIDRQHQNLIAIVNDFNQALTRGEGAKITYAILNRLVLYAETHFRDEEKLMQMARFPPDQLNTHIKEHVKLTEEIFHHCENWSTYGKESLPGIGKFLAAWLLGHILKSDMKYSKYVAKIDDKFLSVK